jgi:hypothetical protein
MVYIDWVWVPGDVTVIVMLPTAPAVPAAVNVTERFSPPAKALLDVGAPLRHPIVNETPGPLIVPMAASAVTATVVPAAIGLPFPSITVKLIAPVLGAAGGAPL